LGFRRMRARQADPYQLGKSPELMGLFDKNRHE
jgi:hypothetical protein